MHPDQFNVINSLDDDIFKRTVNELSYHADVLDAMHLDNTAKIQIHIGGVYRDRPGSLKRFVERYSMLPETVRRRLVIENDDRHYTLADCLYINNKISIPVLFDALHHSINCSGENTNEAFEKFTTTWKASDGLPMVDYSSQSPGDRRGIHTESIVVEQFQQFLAETKGYDFDIMLEIKDKECSALKAIEIVSRYNRFDNRP